MSDRARHRPAQRRRRRAPRAPARREQQRRGHDVVVVAGTLAEGEESMEYVADELGVHVLKLPALQRQLSPRADSEAIRRLVGILRTRRPDVLHTHTAKAGATGRIAALLAGSAAPEDGRPHLPRPRPQRLLQPPLGARLPPHRVACSRTRPGR